MSEWNSIIFQLGFGAISGFAVGYAFKKVLKLTLIISGLLILALMYLQWQGTLNVNYGELFQKVEGWIRGLMGEGSTIISQAVANLPFVAAFLAGFALGLKKG